MPKKQEDKWVDFLIDSICESYNNDSFHRVNGNLMPSREVVIRVLGQLQQVLFPGFYGETGVNGIKKSNIKYYVGDLLNEIIFNLTEEIFKAFNILGEKKKTRNQCVPLARRVLSKLPKIRALLMKDIQAALDGDPAAKSFAEVIISYPCVEVITVYRIAHELYELEIPLIPRMLSEYAHSRTGVDIHPGAKIGEYFFIDHGTGVVIGETTVIGSYVKIYQGVTLGALSFPKDEDGKIIKGLKRHPTIEDNVTIYANATILGGKTVIGRDAVIGGNAWIMDSVKPGEKVKKGA